MSNANIARQKFPLRCATLHLIAPSLMIKSTFSVAKNALNSTNKNRKRSDFTFFFFWDYLGTNADKEKVRMAGLKGFAKNLGFYLVSIGAIFGATAGAVYYFASNFLAFLSLYPWVLLFEGLFLIFLWSGATFSKEGDDGVPQQSYERTYFIARSKFFMRKQLTYEWLLLFLGVTLVGAAFFLLWLWSL